MIKLNETKDIRIQILLYLEREDHALEQISANLFLSKLKTVRNTADLGTIRRSLRDLLQEQFIMETNDSNIIRGCDLETMQKRVIECGLIPSKERSDPQRFIDSVGDAPKIPEIYLGITLKGKTFLMERRMAEVEHELFKKSIEDLDHKKGIRPIEKWIFYGGFIIAVIGLIKSILG